MNFLTIVVSGSALLGVLFLFFFVRDLKNKNAFLGKQKTIGLILILFLIAGVLFCFQLLVEPWTLVTHTETVKITNLNQPLKIAFITDPQVGNHKKTAWLKKIVTEIDRTKPDLILLGGDLIDNEGNADDESQYLEPLKNLVGQYPIFAVLGNHEYGIGNKTREFDEMQTGDRSAEVIERLKILNIPLLRNQLICQTIKNQPICIFGADDIWNAPINFSELNSLDKNVPLVFLTHNPDGILSWPKEIKKPDLVLAGHTHGGQIWLPGVGPLGNAGIDLDKKFYRGLNYWEKTPIITSVGAGESGGPIRFGVPPEIVIIELE